MSDDCEFNDNLWISICMLSFKLDLSSKLWFYAKCSTSAKYQYVIFKNVIVVFYFILLEKNYKCLLM